MIKRKLRRKENQDLGGRAKDEGWSVVERRILNKVEVGGKASRGFESPSRKTSPACGDSVSFGLAFRSRADRERARTNDGGKGQGTVCLGLDTVGRGGDLGTLETDTLAGARNSKQMPRGNEIERGQTHLERIRVVERNRSHVRPMLGIWKRAKDTYWVRQKQSLEVERDQRQPRMYCMQCVLRQRSDVAANVGRCCSSRAGLHAGIRPRHLCIGSEEQSRSSKGA